MIGDSTHLIHEIVESFEARLAASPFELVTLDRIDIPKAMPSTLAHRGYGVDAPSGANSGKYRDATLARSEERIKVVLSYRVNPQQQRASRNEALLIEDQVVRWLTDPTWEGDLHVRWVDSTRAPHAQSSEWYLITLTFLCARDVRLGG